MDKRKLIFANLLNGVPEWQLAETCHMLPEDVRAIFRFVTRKIKSYLFERRRPPIFCDSLSEAQRNRVLLLPILFKLNLDKEPTFDNIQHERVTSGNVESAFRQLR